MAQACPDYTCVNDWETLPAVLCPAEFNGGMDKMILLRCGVERADLVQDADPDLLDETKVQALITENDAIVVEKIQVTFEAPSGVSGNSYDPCKPERVKNYDRSAVINDPNVTRERVNFWDSVNVVNGLTNGGVLVHECDGDRWWYVEGNVDMDGGPTSPENNGESQVITVNMTWRSKSSPEIFPAAELIA